MHIPCCRRNRHCRCRHCCGVVSLSHHHVSFFVVTAAVTVAFATGVVVAAVAAKAPQLSLPQSSMIGDRRPSAVVDGVVVVIVIVIVVIIYPPLSPLVDVDDVARLIHAAPGLALGQTLDDINAKTLEDL